MNLMHEEKSDMDVREIELVYFDGCPNADRARESLRVALGGGSWREWNLSSTDTPERFRRYGSPTVLIGGHDVTGDGGATGAMACRADGAPAPEVIRTARAPQG